MKNREFSIGSVKIIYILAALLLVSPASRIAAGGGASVGPGAQQPLAFVTYVHYPYQWNAAAALIDCIRTWGGEYSDSPIYVVVTDPDFLKIGLGGKNVTLVPLKLDDLTAGFPYAVKARVAAKVEKIVAGQVRALAWFDPDTLLFGPPKEMDLGAGISAAVAPVQFINTGQPPDEPVNAYWGPIYGRVGLDAGNIFAVETRVDRRTIRAYLNCGMFAVRPEKGLLREWARIQDELLRDPEFQRAAITAPVCRTFLHQAVFSAIVVRRLERKEIHFFSPAYNYPLYCHGLDFSPQTGGAYRVPADMRAAKLEGLVSVFYESLFRDHSDWPGLVPPADEPLRSWLTALVDKYLAGKR
jgi:hypothetical protein